MVKGGRRRPPFFDSQNKAEYGIGRMTDEITIKPGLISDHGWDFIVSIGGYISRIHLTSVYWKKLSHGGISPQDLIRTGVQIVAAKGLTESLPPECDFESLAGRIQDFEHQVKQIAHAEAAANPR